MAKSLTRTKRHLILNANRHGRDFVVGDLHGCYKQLKKALKAVGFKKSRDRLISVGDLINRGNHNLDCLGLLDKDWFYAVLGNHEMMLLSSLMKNKKHKRLARGGGDWINGLSEAEAKYLRALVRDHVAHLPHSITLYGRNLKIGICHADPPSDWRRVETCSVHPDRLTSRRDRIHSDSRSWISNVDLVFVGHTPMRKIKALGNVVYIDTAVHQKRGSLTLLELPSNGVMRFLQPFS